MLLTKIIKSRFSNLSKSSSTSIALSNVKNIIGISSCKGGVGKSTVSINLAMSLAKLLKQQNNNNNNNKIRVGLLDCDVYGPSLPYMIKPDDNTIYKSLNHSNLIEPINYNNLLKILSFGFVNPKAGIPGAGGRGAAVLKGPLVSKVIHQLILGTDWGELDYLIIDMPPGTGDIHITISQLVQLSGVLLVTTPQKLSYVDVIKGIEMFQELKVPSLAIIENMSYFDGDDGKRYYPFGNTKNTKKILDEFHISDDFIYKLPISSNINNLCEEQRTIYDSPNENKELIDLYMKLCHNLKETLNNIENEKKYQPNIIYNKNDGITFHLYERNNNNHEYIKQIYNIKPYELRIINPQTGEIIDDKNTISKDIIPLRFDIRGHFGVSITWSDGPDPNIYSFDIIKKIAKIIYN